MQFDNNGSDVDGTAEQSSKELEEGEQSSKELEEGELPRRAGLEDIVGQTMDTMIHFMQVQQLLLV